MGLPIWRSSSPVDSKATLKADLTAASRSPIRRVATIDSAVQNSIRRRVHEDSEGPPPYSPQSPRSQTFREHRQSQLREREAARRRRAARLVEIGVASELEAANEFTDAGITLRPDLDDHAPPPVPESRNYLRRDTPRTAADDRDREAAFRARQNYWRRRGLRARLPASPDNERTAQDPPETSDASNDMIIASAGDNPSSQRPLFATPPSNYLPHYTFGTSSNNTRERPHTETETTEWPVSESARRLRERVSSLPPLRRMGRRSVVDGPLPASSLRESWSPATTAESARMDGLGDRERSVTPEHWDTMLRTIHPDPHLPSTDSSFTSAAASASFSNSHPSSRPGSQHSASSLSSAPSEVSAFDPTEVIVGVCETSDEEDLLMANELPNETVLRRQSRLARRGGSWRFPGNRETSDNNNNSNDIQQFSSRSRPTAWRARSRRVVPDDENFDNNNLRNDLQQAPRRPRATARRSGGRFFDNRETASRNVRSSHSTNLAGPSFDTFAESTPSRDFDQMGSLFRTISREANEQDAPVPAIPNRLTADEFHSHTHDADLEDLRPVLERMVQRDDIPEGFWMSVGLTPHMARNVNRTEASSRTRAGDDSGEAGRDEPRLS